MSNSMMDKTKLRAKTGLVGKALKPGSEVYHIFIGREVFKVIEDIDDRYCKIESTDKRKNVYTAAKAHLRAP